MILILTAYFCLRLLILHEKSDTQYLTYEVETFFKRDNFTSENGFNVAFALTEYDSVRESIEDPDYGVLKAYHYRWGMGERGSVKEEIKTESCTEAELHLNEDQHGESKTMYHIQELSIDDVRFYKDKFKCVRDDVVI